MLNPVFWLQAIALAFSQIRANLGRSLLTALGIIVGVASVTAVIAALSGLKTKVLSEFESFGANRLFIFPDRPDDAPKNAYPWKDVRLKVEEVDAIERAICPGEGACGGMYTANTMSSAFEALGMSPRICPGRADNLKITTNEDLDMARFIVSGESQ